MSFLTASDAVAHTLIILKRDFSRYTLFYMEDAESHPIPQDVTGFQFKIIGDMTIKQFAYLMGSVFLGWVFYQLPIITIIKLPLALCIGGIGPALAFLPLGGRPMDLMIFKFIESFFKPTRFVYQKTGGSAWLSTVTAQLPIGHRERAQTQKEFKRVKTTPLVLTQGSVSIDNNYPLPLPKIQTAPPIIQAIIQEQTSSPHIVSMYSFPTSSQSEPSKPIPNTVAKIQGDKNDALKKRVLELEKDLEARRKEKADLEQKQSVSAFSNDQGAIELERQLQGVLAQKEALTKQLITLQQKLDLQKKNVFAPTMASSKSDLAKTQNVKQIPKGMGKNIGLPITPESPNIITGIIKDPRGNPLGNILVEVKDKEGNPVRAFKTNGLGQFISATALANGEYTVLFEDPKGQNKFDAIGFKASGEIILPIEVTSIDEREELRKSLFREN